MIIPCFSSHYSLGQSILSLESEDKILDDAPVSVFAIAKNYEIKDLYLIENNFSGFIEALENSKKAEVNLRFGLKICVCDDLNTKDENSLKNESNIIIWVLNEQGYYDALKIYNKAAIDGFYYIPRTDWKEINEKWTENLALSFPFYSSFLANNYMFVHGATIVPNLSKIKNYNFFIESHELPFDPYIQNKVLEYVAANESVALVTHTCYYYKNEDVLEHMIRRCSAKRSNWDKPELKHYSSDKFSFESYLEGINKKIL